MAITEQHTHKIGMCCVLLFVKCEVHRCDSLQFLVHFYSQVLSIGSFNFNLSSQYILLGTYIVQY